MKSESRSSPKRVLFMSHVGDPGGAEFKMIDLCRSLGSQAAVLLFERGSLEMLLQRAGIPCVVRSMPEPAKVFRKRGGVLQMIRAIPSVLSMVGDVARHARRFDVVVCFSQKSFVVAVLAKPFMRRPILWFMNDILSREHFSGSLIRTLMFMARFGADRVVLASVASLEAWRARGGKDGNVAVIYPGVAIPNQVDRVQRTKGAPLIGMFGRLCHWKGQDVFLKAVARLPAVKAVVAGAALFGEEDYGIQLKRLVKDLDLGERVTFLGHVENSMTLMASCDVVVHCSTAPEPFGLVIVESMLVGTPVIASDAGGAREIVVPDQTGQLTPLSDEVALARAIQRYLDDPAWSSQVAQRARAQAEEKFSVAAMTNGFHAVLSAM